MCVCVSVCVCVCVCVFVCTCAGRRLLLQSCLTLSPGSLQLPVKLAVRKPSINLSGREEINIMNIISNMNKAPAVSQKFSLWLSVSRAPRWCLTNMLHFSGQKFMFLSLQLSPGGFREGRLDKRAPVHSVYSILCHCFI